MAYRAGTGTCPYNPIPNTYSEPALAAASEQSSETADPLRWAIHVLILAGAALLLGGAFFTMGVAAPSAAERGERGLALAPLLRRRFGLIGALIAGVVLVALLLDMVEQLMSITGVGFSGALGKGNQAWTLISTTLYGFAWLLKVASAIALLGVMLFVWRRRLVRPLKVGLTPWELTVAVGALLLLGEALSSHAAAIHTGDGHSHDGGHTLGLPLPILSDWLHLASVSVWVGGLFYMVFVLFPAFRAAGFSPAERSAFLGRAIPRFSRLAVVSVVILAATGTYK